MKARRAIGFVLLSAAVAAASAALAVDDGGGRSVFARGAGDRALALGGAFVAVADDPSAIVWNPAGLAGLQRASLYAAQTDLVGMGFSEQLGVLALPHWRRGTFALGFRRFGVDGIEQRDGRGTILDDDLSDTETEISLAFGRPVGRAWRLGLTAKLQQQDLAGYRDAALGLDAGLLVKPLAALGGTSGLAEGLSLGLGIRNLIEPTLRLDTDGVSDPMGVRLGAAVAACADRDIGLLAAVDVEKTREMDPRLHAGAELQLLRTLALRVGSNDGMLTAGAGLRYGGLAFDYAFEDNPLEPVHRFGLGMAFGRTTAENRRSAQAAEETALQRKLAEAFARENRSRNDGILAEARQALRDDDPGAALDHAATLRVLDPDCPGLGLVEAAAHLEQGRKLEETGDLSGAAIAFQRSLSLDPENRQTEERLHAVRTRSDEQAARTAEIRRMLDRALESFAAGDLVPARDGFREILALNPEDREAGTLLHSAEQTIGLQAGTLADQARVLAQAGNPQEARRVLAQARALNPEHPSLAAITRMIARLEQAPRPSPVLADPAAGNPDRTPAVRTDNPPAAASAPSFAALSFKRKSEVARLYKEGLTALENGRRADAIGYWELVWSAAPDYQQVTENLKQEYLVQGLEAFASGQLDGSIEIWERALEVAPGDPRTQGYLARAYEHRAKIRQIRGDQ